MHPLFADLERRKRAERQYEREHANYRPKQVEWLRQILWHLEQGHELTDLDGCFYVVQNGQRAATPLVPTRGTRALIKKELVERVKGDPRGWQLSAKAEALVAYLALGGSYERDTSEW